MAHIILTFAFVLTRLALHQAGVEFGFSLDWMWMADPADLRDRLAETLLYFHAFPPGMNLLTGVLLKAGGSHPAALAHAFFTLLGIVQVNAMAALGRALGLGSVAAGTLALVFSLTPAAIYFEHLYLYEWPVTTLLVVTGVLFHRALGIASARAWIPCFGACALIGLTRSTFHLAWFLGFAGLAWWSQARPVRARVAAAALGPALLLLALYAKKGTLFGEFAASSFGPASFHLVTVAQLPRPTRDEWIGDGRLSAFAAISPYAPPRAYQPFFATSELPGWPRSVTSLTRTSVGAPNFNHWFLLEVHRARRADARHTLRWRPLDYPRTVWNGLVAYAGPSTEWHPQTDTARSPHAVHRAALGTYEAWYTRLVHTVPLAPAGLYTVVPLLWLWGAWRATAWRRDAATRARGALLWFCLLQVLYVTAASTMLTARESSRYRFQVEPFIWLLAAVAVQHLIRSGRARWMST